MRNVVFSILLLCGLVGAQGDNWNWLLDTASITDTIGTTTELYTASFELANAEDIWVLLKCDDTTSAGFASDSVKLQWGYQTGSLSYDSGGSIDTLWMECDRVIIDTMDVDSFGQGDVGYCGVGGSLTQYWYNAADTSDIAGYAVQKRWFLPVPDMLIRFWAKGLTGHKTGAAIKCVFDVKRRMFTYVRER